MPGADDDDIDRRPRGRFRSHFPTQKRLKMSSMTSSVGISPISLSAAGKTCRISSATTLRKSLRGRAGPGPGNARGHLFENELLAQVEDDVAVRRSFSE